MIGWWLASIILPKLARLGPQVENSTYSTHKASNEDLLYYQAILHLFWVPNMAILNSIHNSTPLPLSALLVYTQSGQLDSTSTTHRLWPKKGDSGYPGKTLQTNSPWMDEMHLRCYFSSYRKVKFCGKWFFIYIYLFFFSFLFTQTYAGKKCWPQNVTFRYLISSWDHPGGPTLQKINENYSLNDPMKWMQCWTCLSGP